jgi:hypothetical protein
MNAPEHPISRYSLYSVVGRVMKDDVLWLTSEANSLDDHLRATGLGPPLLQAVSIPARRPAGAARPRWSRLASAAVTRQDGRRRGRWRAPRHRPAHDGELLRAVRDVRCHLVSGDLRRHWRRAPHCQDGRRGRSSTAQLGEHCPRKSPDLVLLKSFGPDPPVTTFNGYAFEVHIFQKPPTGRSRSTRPTEAAALHARQVTVVISSSLPMLKTCPTASGWSHRRTSAATASPTQQKHRD